MARKKMQDNAESKAITVRVKPEEYEIIKDYADSKRASLNTVVCEAIAQYGAKIERRHAIERINDLRRRIYEAHGLGTDSVELLRELREERTDQIIAASEAPARKPKGGPKP